MVGLPAPAESSQLLAEINATEHPATARETLIKLRARTPAISSGVLTAHRLAYVTAYLALYALDVSVIAHFAQRRQLRFHRSPPGSGCQQ